MQNSDEYSQEWKSSTLQAQNQNMRDQKWATGLNSSTWLNGAREQALEYLVKCLIRFQNRTFNQIQIMPRYRSNEYVQNLEFHQVQASASKKVIITVSDLFSFMY